MLDTIEYIGPRPQKPRKQWRGGWLMIFLVVCCVSYAGWFFVQKGFADGLRTKQYDVEKTVVWLSEQDGFGNMLAIAALERTKEEITYDPAYYKISYPNGDVPEGKGVCTDVVVRSYRTLGIDLQQLVHEDMEKNFRIYPQIWKAPGPDSNIDHRRVPNLQRFFSRFGQELAVPENGRPSAENFEYGDVVAWLLPHGATHTGVVVPGPGDQKSEKWIVHNIGSGPKWEDKLLEYQVIGHYRYDGTKKQ